MQRRTAILALLSALGVTRGAHALGSGPRRTQPVRWIVIHSTGGPTCDAASGRPVWVHAGTLEQDLHELEAHPKLGIHYMIGRDGTVRASVPEDRIAYHVFHYSTCALGIELVNEGDGVDPFPDAQIDALVELLREMVRRHPLARERLVRHSDLDHGRMSCDRARARKVDPGTAFPLEAVRERVFAPAAGATAR